MSIYLVYLPCQILIILKQLENDNWFPRKLKFTLNYSIATKFADLKSSELIPSPKKKYEKIK